MLFGLTYKDWGTLLALILSCIALGDKIYGWYKAAKAPGENTKNQIQNLNEKQAETDREIEDLRKAMNVELEGLKKSMKIDHDRLHDTAHDLVKLRNEYEQDHSIVRKLEDGQTAILYGIDALLDNAINGDNLEGLKAAKKHMTKHMIEG